MNFSSIETLTGSNYKNWKRDIEILLGLMDYDLAIREDEPTALTEASTTEQRTKHEKWEKSNRMALNVMRKAMTSAVRGGITVYDKAKNFLEAIEMKFKESEKAETDLMLNQQLSPHIFDPSIDTMINQPETGVDTTPRNEEQVDHVIQPNEP
ncbi:unnamed protein product [Prunus armeniaca]